MLANIFLILLQLTMLTDSCNYYYSDFCDSYTNEIETNDLNAKMQEMKLKRQEKRGIHKRSAQPPFLKNERVLSTQISSILDKLFNNTYDSQLRPQLDVKPLEVTINLAVRSMGPVDEQKQTFSLDCYFRQYWRDERLKYNSTRLKELPMNWQFLYKIWRPDTYIVNGKRSYLHKMTTPNRFIRIAPDGMISYSQRLTVKARCQMDLRKFPLDNQECPLEIGSFGHETRDITYKWMEEDLDMQSLGLAQYHLIHYSYSSFNGVKANTFRNVSTVTITFQFQRQQGFYLLQIYIPLTLIVMCSWVTFWLSKTDKGTEIPARTSLGASSVLSVVTIGFGGKSKPQVGYATALDVFIILCFMNVFGALIEFAFLNFLDTLVRRLKRKDNESKLVLLMAHHEVMGGRIPKLPKRQESMMDTDGIMSEDDILTPPESSTPTASEDKVFDFNGTPAELAARLEALRREEENKNCLVRFVDSVISCIMFFNCCRSVRKMEIFKKPHVVFNRVDNCCRKLFPLTFLLLNFLYWAGYVYLF